ncbi:hypothetical protein [Nonomuraea sp. LPB2021202275-12-8]|uniref:hypothetical protein n=1 Tax=Nonomuraea sp. LPB2021202275-12-8 TaxID=3120159 RepID=UPI00300CBB96
MAGDKLTMSYALRHLGIAEASGAKGGHGLGVRGPRAAVAVRAGTASDSDAKA